MRTVLGGYIDEGLRCLQKPLLRLILPEPADQAFYRTLWRGKIHALTGRGATMGGLPLQICPKTIIIAHSFSQSVLPVEATSFGTARRTPHNANAIMI